MTLVETAIGYATQLGWPIFPASITTKKPLIKTGRDHAEHASRDPAQIHQWFAIDFPNAAIAMPTGAASGVVVVDADAKHDGERLLAELELRLGPLPRNMIVRTQSGGIHVYTRHPGSGTRIKSTAGDLVGPGVDIRGDGGIVLLPPSAGYRWEISISDFAPLPDAWIAELSGTRRHAPEPIGPITYASTIDTQACWAALRGLRRRYRSSKRAGDDDRADLIDRIVEGKSLAEIGSRDEHVTRAGFIIGCVLPAIGPVAAEALASRALVLIPVPLGDAEDYAHWCRKFRASYEAGSRAYHEHSERNRKMWLELADLLGRSSL